MNDPISVSLLNNAVMLTVFGFQKNYINDTEMVSIFISGVFFSKKMIPKRYHLNPLQEEG
jgi:hypothetical protein